MEEAGEICPSWDLIITAGVLPLFASSTPYYSEELSRKWLKLHTFVLSLAFNSLMDFFSLLNIFFGRVLLCFYSLYSDCECVCVEGFKKSYPRLLFSTMWMIIKFPALHFVQTGRDLKATLIFLCLFFYNLVCLSKALITFHLARFRRVQDNCVKFNATAKVGKRFNKFFELKLALRFDALCALGNRKD